MLRPTKLPRIREVLGETDSASQADVYLLQMKSLQGMRKILAYADVALASSLFAAAQKQVESTERCLETQISDVNLKRTQTLERHMQTPVTKHHLLAWASTEKGWLAGVERTRLQWQQDATAAAESEKNLQSAITKRKIIELKYYKYEEMMNMMESNLSDRF